MPYWATKTKNTEQKVREIKIETVKTDRHSCTYKSCKKMEQEIDIIKLLLKEVLFHQIFTEFSLECEGSLELQ